MSVTVAIPDSIPGLRANNVVGAAKERVREVTLDSSYVQTGEPINPSDFGLIRFYTLEPLGFAITSAGTTGWAVTAQVADDGLSALLFVHGQQPADTTTTSIAFPDADSTEDLSSLSVIMRATGF